MLPCTAYLEGEYGIDGLYMGVPVKLGAGGIEEIVELDLTDEERGWLDESAAAVRDVVGVLTTCMDLGLGGRTAIVCGASAGMGLGDRRGARRRGSERRHVRAPARRCSSARRSASARSPSAAT